ncbi:MAG TPA: hypothetical protein VN920_13085, partial [Pyrinomonadaceae bacterium]|nr:hypothetical protein [Pyrinomonadaceae bacterium]
VIIGTTTLAFTFGGLSIVLVLVLLRGGVLVIAPLVDTILSRRVRWFSWAAMLTSLLAVLVVLADAGNEKLSLAAIVDIAAYLTAYFFKLQFMTRLAKSRERSTTLRYFVEEVMIASPLLLLALGVMAFIGAGNVMMGFRLGFTSFLGTKGLGFALLVGLFYAGLNVCTTLIFLDRRENTFCVPMHCGSSMLAGLTATYALTSLFNQKPPNAPQIVSAALIVVALGFLSPLHHFDRVLARLNQLLAGVDGILPSFVTGIEKTKLVSVRNLERTRAELLPTTEATDQDHLDALRRVFLFVCSGNTCRSPMAAAIGNAEIATRLRIPFAALDQTNLPALSAGLSARVGAPLTPEAHEALRSLGVPVTAHSARNLTVDLVDQFDKIFCMTQAHRKAVVNMVPDAAAKTHCLDPEGDVEDPIGSGIAAYLNCANNIRRLIQFRLDEMSFGASLQG